MNELFRADYRQLRSVRAISLWQPWASAIALGNKRVETRHWSTPYRGPILIHAARRFSADERAFASTERALGRLPERLPLGAFVAIATLRAVKRAEEIRLAVSSIERLYGNYDDGRYGWVLEDVEALREPIPAVGRQSMWTVEGDILSAVQAQL